MSVRWTNEAAIRQWNATATLQAMEATAEEGDFSKRHLVNPVVPRLLGDVAGRRVLDAGAGNGYLSRTLAARGAHVAVEPTDSMVAFARAREGELGQGVAYVQAARKYVAVGWPMGFGHAATTSSGRGPT